MLQLDLFMTVEECERADTARRLLALQRGQDKMRKKLFCEMNSLRRDYKEIKEELDAWKRTMSNQKVIIDPWEM